MTMDDEKEPLEDNQHIRLAKMGAETWNRWARTIITNRRLDELNLSEGQKLLIGSIEPFNTQEQAALAEKLEIRDLDSFSSKIDFSEQRIDFPCREFLFFSDVIFFNNTFTELATFEESIFTGNAEFVNSNFPAIANFWGVTFIEQAYYRDVTFDGYALFDKCNFAHAVFLGATFAERATFEGATFNDHAIFRGATFNNHATFSGVTFTKNADFADTSFNQNANFTDATFIGKASFANTIVVEHAIFEGATFTGHAIIQDATFNKGSNFDDTIFTQKAIFAGTTFCMAALFTNTKFKSSTSFRNVVFGKPPRFHNADLHQSITFYQAQFKDKTTEDTSTARSAWRTLKVAMAKTHHHDQELIFFTYEMMCKRKMFKEEEKWLNGAALTLYDWTSKFGVSVRRPLKCLFGSFVLFSLIHYSTMSVELDQMLYTDLVEKLYIATGYSLVNTVPFVSSIKPAVAAYHEAHLAIPTIYIQLLAVLQSVISATLLFLTGLALKHKFSIK
jgi:hypothetical protein